MSRTRSLSPGRGGWIMTISLVLPTSMSRETHSASRLARNSDSGRPDAKCAASLRSSLRFSASRSARRALCPELRFDLAFDLDFAFRCRPRECFFSVRVGDPWFAASSSWAAITFDPCRPTIT
eukprot:Amastigsp_a190766_3.p2 type:complete len:123 gc:universal Amastigsp_a190766_3:300-668(+)